MFKLAFPPELDPPPVVPVPLALDAAAVPPLFSISLISSTACAKASYESSLSWSFALDLNNSPKAIVLSISILLIESAILEIPSAALSKYPFLATSPNVTINELKSSNCSDIFSFFSYSSLNVALIEVKNIS